MPLKEVYETAIVPALELLPPKMSSKRAVVMMLAIGLQESRLIHRRQIKGPARGLWQFERGGGVRGVLNFHSTHDLAKHIALDRIGKSDANSVYEALEHDDVLAAVFSRLLLWTDPRSLPAIGDAEGAWNLYARTWRPGKPHRHTWDALYKQATDFAEKL